MKETHPRAIRWYLLALFAAFVLCALFFTIHYRQNDELCRAAVTEFSQGVFIPRSRPSVPVLCAVLGYGLLLGMLLVLGGFLLPLGLYMLWQLAYSFSIQLAAFPLNGIPMWKALLFCYLPHGIVHIPATLLSLAIGARLMITMLRCLPLSDDEALPVLKWACTQAWRLFMLVNMPLIILTAVLECYVTPYIAALL